MLEVRRIASDRPMRDGANEDLACVFPATHNRQHVVDVHMQLAHHVVQAMGSSHLYAVRFITGIIICTI